MSAHPFTGKRVDTLDDADNHGKCGQGDRSEAGRGLMNSWTKS